MAKSYRLTPLAEIDIEEIWLYSNQNWGGEQADTYHQNIINTIASLINGHKQGRPVSSLPDFHKVLCGAHVIYFIETDSSIDVIRILHQKQDVELNLIGYP
ncbi:type II toxin-antitoxin system RelE/ParE family toxin [Thorsellia anophelis]|uniref:Toxin n=1 Tax=Thorsellia anophelis DSM 18579 TaxID=1123402 RepID=A0A1I0FWW8_9GAMM|nr:type II toxin-antitoxin system RelE/ParE family toxin [Thorsellia anophelis]SET61984.1 toxin ParE1/3/4 [Thorsellia anophelis DSM 18579]